MDTHAGRIAVVTGAARGFGHAISCELARRGADIIAIDLNPADATVSAVQQAGQKALSLQADLSDPEQVAAITAGLLGFAGRVDILINNAGVFPAKDVFELDFTERKARVAELCGSRGPRVVVEAAGVLSAFGEGVDLTGHNGAYLLIGLWSGHGTTPVDPTVLVHKNLRIIGSCFAQPEHYYRAMHLAAQLEQRLPLAEIITHRFDVFRADEALDTVENGLAVKAVIQPTRQAEGAAQVR